MEAPGTLTEGGAVRVSVDVALQPAAALDALLEELGGALRRHGLRLDHRGGATAGGHGVVLEWRPASGEADRPARLEVRAERVDGGSRLTVEQCAWGGAVGPARELAGWFAAAVATPFLEALTPSSVGDWVTDRQARKPSGPAARATYRDPLYHYPNFRAILAELALTAEDRLLEVACGGGAFLRMALESGCRATGVDYSPDMVAVAREQNRRAIEEGRLYVLEARAEALPLPPRTFTCAVMTGVLGFLPDPVAALKELHRVLAPGGRAVVMGSDPETRGTPAAPEPMASRLRFYDDRDLEYLGRAAGFESVHAVRRDLEAYARESGVPEEAIPLFGGPGSRFLLLNKQGPGE